MLFSRDMSEERRVGVDKNIYGTFVSHDKEKLPTYDDILKVLNWHLYYYFLINFKSRNWENLVLGNNGNVFSTHSLLS